MLALRRDARHRHATAALSVFILSLLFGRSATGRSPTTDITVSIEHVTIQQADTLAIAAVLADIQGKLAIIMATTADALAVLGEINAATDDIAGDLEALKAQLAAVPGVPDAVMDGLTAASSRLSGIASAFPAPATPPEETPGDEPLPA